MKLPKMDQQYEEAKKFEQAPPTPVETHQSTPAVAVQQNMGRSSPAEMTKPQKYIQNMQMRAQQMMPQMVHHQNLKMAQQPQQAQHPPMMRSQSPVGMNFPHHPANQYVRNVQSPNQMINAPPHYLPRLSNIYFPMNAQGYPMNRMPQQQVQLPCLSQLSNSLNESPYMKMGMMQNQQNRIPGNANLPVYVQNQQMGRQMHQQPPPQMNNQNGYNMGMPPNQASYNMWLNRNQ